MQVKIEIEFPQNSMYSIDQVFVPTHMFSHHGYFDELNHSHIASDRAQGTWSQNQIQNYILFSEFVKSLC